MQTNIDAKQNSMMAKNNNAKNATKVLQQVKVKPP